jgi:hypothetical protein
VPNPGSPTISNAVSRSSNQTMTETTSLDPGRIHSFKGSADRGRLLLDRINRPHSSDLDASAREVPSLSPAIQHYRFCILVPTQGRKTSFCEM